MAYTEETREQEVAMVFLDTWGSTSYPPSQWGRFRWSENGAPEWLGASDLPDCEPNECVRVLDFSVGEPSIPDTHRIVYRYQAGERECPDCRADDAPEEWDDQPKRSECTLCEGSGYLYWGEECCVLVLAPRYSYGLGMSGCLYDSGPHSAESVEAAIDGLCDLFCGDCGDVSEDEEVEMRADLAANGIHYFREPSEAGAQYCEIRDLRGES